MGARLVRIVTRIAAGGVGILILFAASFPEFDVPQMAAVLAIVLWLVLVEAAVALARIEPPARSRREIHTDF
jgi:hypothetical protein